MASCHQYYSWATVEFFFYFLIGETKQSSFSPVQSLLLAIMDLNNVPIHVVHSTHTRIPSGSSDLKTVLSESRPNDTVSKFIFDCASSTFVLWQFRVSEASNSTSEDAIIGCGHFVTKNALSKGNTAVIHYTCDADAPPDHKSSEGRSFFIFLRKLDGYEDSSIPVSFQERRALDERSTEMRERHRTQSWHESGFATRLRGLSQDCRTRNRLLGAVLLMLLLLMTGFVFARYHKPETEWIRYLTPGSTGPKYQYQFTHHNVSRWAAEHPHSNGEWAVRIDDQAMIPVHLLDETEAGYQRWFQKRYPEMDQVVQREDYLNESWLGSLQINVPSDHQFHFAHCALALRRYWIARESGKHVCGRDIDYRHIKHCLDRLDEKAFVDGPRVAEDRTVLIWETKVCY